MGAAGNKDLYNAAEDGRLEKVKTILASGGANIDWKHPVWNDRTALHIAAFGGRDDVVNVLISYRANVNALDKDKHTPLHWAAYSSSSNTLEILINSKADINAQSIGGGTPLHRACYFDKIANVKVLLKYSADINVINKKKKTALDRAREMDYTAVIQCIEQFIQKKTDTVSEEKFDVRKKTQENMTSEKLHEHPKSEIVKNKDLYNAAKYGRLEEVKAILATGGANIDCKHRVWNDRTALHAAALGSHEDVVNVLISHRADINALDKFNRTPFHWAAYSSSSNTLEILLNSNADINAQTKDGWTPLHSACVFDKIANVKVLLNYSADVNVTDKWGKTSLDYAREENYTAVVQCIEHFTQNNTRIVSEEKSDVATDPKVTSPKIHKQPKLQSVHQYSSEKQNVQSAKTSPKVPEKFKDLKENLKKWKLSRFFDFFVDNDVDMEILRMFDVNELLADLKESDFKIKLSEKKLIRAMLKGLSGSEEKTNIDDMDKWYPINKGKSRGVALVIGNGNDGEIQDTSHKDANRMEDVLSKAGYKVIHWEDLSDKSLKMKTVEVSSEIPKDCDSFVMYYSGHGYGEKILGDDVDLRNASQDGVGVDIRQIVEYFQPLNCVELRGKPKIFFWDCCRGGEKDESKGWGTVGQKQQYIVPKYSDCFYGYSSAPSFVSYCGDSSTDGLSVWTFFLANRLENNIGKNDIHHVLLGVDFDTIEYGEKNPDKKQASNYQTFLKMPFLLM